MRLMECQGFARSYWQRYAGPNGEWNREVERVHMDLNQLAAWQESWDRTEESLKAWIFCVGDIQGNDRQVWEDHFNAVAPTDPGDGGDGWRPASYQPLATGSASSSSQPGPGGIQRSRWQQWEATAPRGAAGTGP